MTIDYQLMDENSSVSMVAVDGVNFIVESIDGIPLDYIVSKDDRLRIHKAIMHIAESIRGEKISDDELRSFPKYLHK